jgi:hypothetical protein
MPETKCGREGIEIDFSPSEQNSDLAASYPHPMASTKWGVKLADTRSKCPSNDERRSHVSLDDEEDVERKSPFLLS